MRAPSSQSPTADSEQGEPSNGNGPRARAAGYGLGIDIGGTNVRAAVVDLRKGELLAHASARHDDYVGESERYSPDAVADEAAELARKVLAQAREKLRDVLPDLDVKDFGHVGLAVAGPCSQLPLPTAVPGVDEYVTHVQPQNIGKGFQHPAPLGAMVARRLGGIDAVLVNDVHGASSEALKGVRNGLHVSVGTGLGAARKSRGQLQGLEVARVRVKDPRTGALVHLEEFIGGKAISRRVAEDLRAGVKTAIRELVTSPEQVNASHVEAAYQARDPYARALWELAGDVVGARLVHLVEVMPEGAEAVVFGGGVLLKCPGLVAELERGYTMAAGKVPPPGFFQKASRGEESGLIGAARLTPGVA